jgi:hypothetical protein
MQAAARIFVSLGLNKKDTAVRKGEPDGYICTHIRPIYKNFQNSTIEPI